MATLQKGIAVVIVRTENGVQTPRFRKPTIPELEHALKLMQRGKHNAQK